MTSQRGSAEANAALVLESFEAVNAGDTKTLLGVVAPDIVMHFAEVPEPLRGRETWQQGFEMMKRAFPDLEAQIDDVVAAEDRVAVRVSFRGTRESSKAFPPRAERSTTSATSSIASTTARSSKSGSAPIWASSPPADFGHAPAFSEWLTTRHCRLSSGAASNYNRRVPAAANHERLFPAVLPSLPTG
jgi:ketosteroid isomerase-like protein